MSDVMALFLKKLVLSSIFGINVLIRVILLGIILYNVLPFNKYRKVIQWVCIVALYQCYPNCYSYGAPVVSS